MQGEGGEDMGVSHHPEFGRDPKASGSSRLKDITTKASSGDVYPTFFKSDTNSAVDLAKSEPLCIRANIDITLRKKMPALGGHLFRSIHALTCDLVTKVTILTWTLEDIISSWMSLSESSKKQLDEF